MPWFCPMVLSFYWLRIIVHVLFYFLGCLFCLSCFIEKESRIILLPILTNIFYIYHAWNMLDASIPSVFLFSHWLLCWPYFCIFDLQGMLQYYFALIKFNALTKFFMYFVCIFFIQGLRWHPVCCVIQYLYSTYLS